VNDYSVIVICRGMGLAALRGPLLDEYLGYLDPVVTAYGDMLHIRVNIRAPSPDQAESFARGKMSILADHIGVPRFAVVDVHAAPAGSP
jgi:hypothetical protein